MSKLNLYVLMDRSGSMSNMRDEALNSINAYVEGLDPSTNFFMAVFDHEYSVIRNTTLKKFKKLTQDEVQPRGNTSLYDSAARIFMRAIDDNNEKTVIAILTDGFENSSKHFNKLAVKQLVDQITKKGWEVIFLGADFDKVDDVSKDFVPLMKSVNVSKGNMTNYFGTELSAMTASYAATGQAFNFTPESKLRAATTQK